MIEIKSLLAFKNKVDKQERDKEVLEAMGKIHNALQGWSEYINNNVLLYEADSAEPRDFGLVIGPSNEKDCSINMTIDEKDINTIFNKLQFFSENDRKADSSTPIEDFEDEVNDDDDDTFF